MASKFFWLNTVVRTPDQEGIGRWNLLIRVYRKLAIGVEIRRYTDYCFGGNRHLEMPPLGGRAPCGTCVSMSVRRFDPPILHQTGTVKI